MMKNYNLVHNSFENKKIQISIPVRDMSAQPQNLTTMLELSTLGERLSSR